ncbi:MAG TPA: ABC transporter permease [Kofleriaceae bacterium]|nr:ABC transporter permease [Kofleriaceae bacterium]
MATSPTMRLLRDEMTGFAKSKVMIVLWVVLPLLAIAGYFLFDFLQSVRAEEAAAGVPDDGPKMSVFVFLSAILSSIAGTVAALMVAVDVVSERQRKVFELFVIRPIRREVIIWSKFIAVFLAVSLACVISMNLAILVDLVRGEPVTWDTMREMVKGLAQAVAVIALATGGGVAVGVVSRTILVAVLIVQFGSQNLTVVPMLPSYLGVAPDSFWVFQGISFALAGMLVWAAGWSFRRAQF